MALLLQYLKRHWSYVLLALMLAAINQVFSLLDPLIFRHIIDSYATSISEYTSSAVLQRRQSAAGRRGRSRFCLARGQELPGLLRQPDHAAVGARIYADGIRHSLELPYAVFRRPAQRRNAGQAAEGSYATWRNSSRPR